MTRKKLLAIYKKLYNHYGPQKWWPADSAFEVTVGAILTQNTSWINVERAISNLKKAGCLSFKGLLKIKTNRLAKLIRPAGYYNIKAKRIKNFISFLKDSCGGSIECLARKDLDVLRKELLCVNGIGQETADSILLYACNKPIFVVDAYTKRIYYRHGLIKEDSLYNEVQEFFMKALPKDTKLFNEYHALIVRLAKDFCRKNNKKCTTCPLN